MKTVNMFVHRFVRLATAFTLLGALAAAAHAESFFIHVPFAFEAAGKTLPPGDYSIEPIATGLLIVRGATAADTVAIPASPLGITDTANPSLSFAHGTDGAVLSGIRMDSGMTFSVASSKRLAAATAVPAKGPVALSHP